MSKKRSTALIAIPWLLAPIAIVFHCCDFLNSSQKYETEFTAILALAGAFTAILATVDPHKTMLRIGSSGIATAVAVAMPAILTLSSIQSLAVTVLMMLTLAVPITYACLIPPVVDPTDKEQPTQSGAISAAADAKDSVKCTTRTTNW